MKCIGRLDIWSCKSTADWLESDENELPSVATCCVIINQMAPNMTHQMFQRGKMFVSLTFMVNHDTSVKHYPFTIYLYVIFNAGFVRDHQMKAEKQHRFTKNYATFKFSSLVFDPQTTPTEFVDGLQGIFDNARAHRRRHCQRTSGWPIPLNDAWHFQQPKTQLVLTFTETLAISHLSFSL